MGGSAATVGVNPDNVKEAVLTLVVALVEILRELLLRQALRRMNGGTLTEDEIERLGETFMRLEQVLDDLKHEHGLVESVNQFRAGLDDLVYDLLEGFVAMDAPDTQELTAL